MVPPSRPGRDPSSRRIPDLARPEHDAGRGRGGCTARGARRRGRRRPARRGLRDRARRRPRRRGAVRVVVRASGLRPSRRARRPVDARLGDRSSTRGRGTCSWAAPSRAPAGASAIPISEFVLGAMLAFEKAFPRVWLDEPPEQWNLDQSGRARGQDPRARRARGDRDGGGALAPSRSTCGCGRCAGGPVATRFAGVELAPDLADLLATADHLVIAAPATAATRKLLDAPAFSLVKPGVHLVNIARGSIVDQDALRVALDDGRVAMASLDTVDPEPLPAGHWMYRHPRGAGRARTSRGARPDGFDSDDRVVRAEPPPLRRRQAARGRRRPRRGLLSAGRAGRRGRRNRFRVSRARSGAARRRLRGGRARRARRERTARRRAERLGIEHGSGVPRRRARVARRRRGDDRDATRHPRRRSRSPRPRPAST